MEVEVFEGTKNDIPSASIYRYVNITPQAAVNCDSIPRIENNTVEEFEIHSLRKRIKLNPEQETIIAMYKELGYTPMDCPEYNIVLQLDRRIVILDGDINKLITNDKTCLRLISENKDSHKVNEALQRYIDLQKSNIKKLRDRNLWERIFRHWE